MTDTINYRTEISDERPLIEFNCVAFLQDVLFKGERYFMAWADLVDDGVNDKFMFYRVTPETTERFLTNQVSLLEVMKEAGVIGFFSTTDYEDQTISPVVPIEWIPFDQVQKDILPDPAAYYTESGFVTL